jgi:hypothetical protein
MRRVAEMDRGGFRVSAIEQTSGGSSFMLREYQAHTALATVSRSPN